MACAPILKIPVPFYDLVGEFLCLQIECFQACVCVCFLKHFFDILELARLFLNQIVKCIMHHYLSFGVLHNSTLG